MTVGSVGILRFDVPVDLDRDSARRLANEELAKASYAERRPGFAQRAWSWLQERLRELFQQASESAPGGRAGLVLVGILLALAVVVVLHRLGPLRPAPSAGERLFGGRVSTSADHQAAAAAHAEQGRWAEAVRESLRAIVRGLEERGLLAARPGRTADEAAAEGSEALPDRADDLREAVRIFDAIWYGARPATPEAAASLDAISSRVRSAPPEPLRPRR